MSYNDRLREASAWVAAHPGETVTVTIGRDDLAEALWNAGDDGRWPAELSSWARSLARLTVGMSRQCLDASVPLDWWEDRSEWLERSRQPIHADCEVVGCTCPCHVSSQPNY